MNYSWTFRQHACVVDKFGVLFMVGRMEQGQIVIGWGKEFVYTGEALRTDSWLKCGSFDGGTPSGMMCTTHKKSFFFLALFF